MNATSLVSKVTDLPSPSPAVAKLMGLLNRPDADNEQVMKIVKCDGVLCAKLLAACNSAANGLKHPVGSVEQAVFHLGYQKIYRIILSLSVGESLSRSLPAYAIDDHDLWRHSLITAVIAESILDDDCTVDLDPSVAYTAALLHDIGKLIITQHLDEDAVDAIRGLIDAGTHTRLEAERAILETDHAEVGACLLQSWNLPATIVEAVAHHHEPVLSPRPLASAVVHVANALAHEIGSAPGWNAYAIRANEEAATALNLSPLKIERLLMTAYGSLQRVEEMALAS